MRTISADEYKCGNKGCENSTIVHTGKHPGGWFLFRTPVAIFHPHEFSLPQQSCSIKCFLEAMLTLTKQVEQKYVPLPTDCEATDNCVEGYRHEGACIAPLS